MKLCNLSLNKSAKITAIDLTGQKLKRFNELGITINATITPIFTSTAGNPVAYLIKGAIIAIRRCDSAFIEVAANEEESTND